LISIVLIVIVSELRRAFPNSLPSPTWSGHGMPYVIIVSSLCTLAAFFAGAVALSQPLYIWKEWRTGRATPGALIVNVGLWLALVTTFVVFERFGYLFPRAHP
jgi:hypothetical protein